MACSEKKFLALSALVFILLFLFFYPPFYQYPDEQQYLRNSYLLLSGKMRITDPLYSYGYASIDGYFATVYPPLQSFFIMPFAFFGWQFAFFSGLFLHLLNFFIFYKILGRLSLPRIFSVLFLFFPVYAFFSATLFSELSSVTMILLAFYFYLGEEKHSRRNFFLSGFFLGFSVLARYTNGIVLICLFLLMLLRNKRGIPFLISGLALPAALVGIYNQFLYGGFFSTAYSLVGTLHFSFMGFFWHFLYFAFLLSLIYPVMFFSAFFSKSKIRAETILCTLAFTGFWSLYWFNNIRFRSEDLVLAITKFAPILFLLIISFIIFFIEAMRRFRLERHSKKIFAFLFMLIIFSSAFTLYSLNKKQSEKALVFEEIYKSTPDGSLIIADEQLDGTSFSKESPYTSLFFSEFFGDRKLITMRQPYEGYIEKFGVDNSYYMRVWIEGGRIMVEIMPWKEHLLKTQQ